VDQTQNDRQNTAITYGLIAVAVLSVLGCVVCQVVTHTVPAVLASIASGSMGILVKSPRQ
jgi:hypothetical protein